MKLTKKLLEKMIREEMGKGPLGNYVFPYELKSKYKSKFPDAEKEKNTEVEDTLRMLLDRHFNKNLPLPNKAIKLMLKMVREKNYPDVFRPFEGGKLYRGLRIPKAMFEEKFGEFPEKPKWYQAPMDWLSGVARKQLQKKATISPETRTGSQIEWYENQVGDWEQHASSMASSWTKSFSAAKNFTKKSDHHGEDSVGVILVAEPKSGSNKFIDLSGIYEYFKLADHYAWEQEVISIGDVDVSGIAWRY